MNKIILTFSIFILGGFVLLALLAPFLGLDGETVSLFNRSQAASPGYILGTDELGRDVLARLIYGARISLLVGLVTALIAASLGTIIGLVSGYFGGVIDDVLMRFTDFILSLPLLPVLIVLTAIDLTKLGISQETSTSNQMAVIRIIIIISLFAWPVVARLARAGTLSARKMDYTKAARALGQRNLYIMVKHILPNILGPVIVATTLAIGNIILLESALSFLGLGIQPPLASWGNMLTDAQEYIWDRPMLAIYPGICIFLTVMSFNILGDWLQDKYNPKREIKSQT